MYLILRHTTVFMNIQMIYFTYILYGIFGFKCNIISTYVSNLCLKIVQIVKYA